MPFEAYTLYLASLVRDPDSDKVFFYLMSDLNSREFYWSIPDDENRAVDGLDLRERFDDMYPEYDIFGSMHCGCTVLEALVALAMRSEHVMYEPYMGDQTYKWFWMMLENLDIAYMDNHYYDQDGPIAVDDAISTWLDRSFSSNGVGSPWPLRTTNDLREISMWNHMQWYLMKLSEEE